VASLGLVSPRAATDGVTLFFLEKQTTFFSHRPLVVVSSPLTSSHVYPVFFLNSATTKINFIRVSHGVTRAVRPLSFFMRLRSLLPAVAFISSQSVCDVVQPRCFSVFVPNTGILSFRGSCASWRDHIIATSSLCLTAWDPAACYRTTDVDFRQFCLICSF